MFRRLAILGLAAALVSTGCSKEEDAASPTTPTVTALPTTVLANGTNTTVITVTSGVGPFSLVTSRGVFVDNGGTSIQIATVNGFATLRPCNAQVNPTCAGPTVVTAAGGDGGVGQLVVTFQGFEDCDNGVDDNDNAFVDCADPQCPLDTACGPNGLVCSSTQQCNKCTVPAPGVVEPSLEQRCGDGVDNDCDGNVDCDDSDCADRSCTTPTGTVGVCDAGGCVCSKTETAESTCGDGVDNDCDNIVDCADPDCVGDVCDASRGLVCAGVAPLTCRVCPTGQTSESVDQCSDGKDNDCDGNADCLDTDCQPSAGPPVVAGKQCNPFGGVCRLTQGVPSCGCPSGATTETSCSDGVDNDCDGTSDCADDDCQPSASGLGGPSCGPNGRACTAAGTCSCPTGEVEVCNNYDALGAAIDDDCDGRANCVDRDCRPATPGGVGADCSNADQFGMTCDATGICGCTGNGGTAEAAELSCDDGFDNDCDFLIDCQDPQCAGDPCGPGGATCGAAFTCVCPGGATESDCDDGLDNNCNGKVDCEEPACAAVACSTAQPSNICISGVCSDPATQYGVAVTPDRPRIPADGKASTTVSVLVTFKGSPKPGVAVSFALSNGALGTLSPAGNVTTDSLGRAQKTFTSSGPAGVETITATVVGVGADGSATVTMPAIGEIRLVEQGILFPVMGVKTSGFQEQNQLTVEVLDTLQEKYPDGLDILFEHRPLGGSTLSDPLAPPACAVTPCVQSRAVTVPNGSASVRLYSGTVAGVVRVSATAVAGGITRLFELPSIAIVGAKPNAGHFSIVCSPENVPAYAGSTCHVSTVDAPFTCVAILKDRYNNVLGRATTVSFMSEAGAVGPPAVTPEYDPDSPPSGQGDLGSAIELINTLGAKLPKDVVRNVGEQFITTAPDVCSVSERSPRDGVVTVVAWTPGEEAFFDANGNGQYDAGASPGTGEPFVDLPEPFVDYDDDDVRDGDEPFIDSNGNGSFDGPNGVWDTSANVWTKTVVVYSGMPAFLRVAGQDFESRWMETADAATYSAPTPTASFAVRPEFPPETFTDCNLNKIRDVAVVEPFTDSNSNGAYDAGEPFEDCNNNGTREAVVAEPFADTNGNGVYDAFKTPATSETLAVAAADRNLNRLATATNYSVTKPENAKFKVSYNGLSQIADRTGVGFGFQPCLFTSPATCALDCADITTPLNARCIMRTRVADFSYGYTSSATFTGGAAGDFDGATQAFWNIVLFGETLVVPVSGTHQ